MKISHLVALVVAALTLNVSAALSEPELRITSVLMPNGVVDASAFQKARNGTPGFGQYVSIVPLGANLASYFETGLEFEFLHPDTGVPVNVQNLVIAADSAKYSVYKNGVAIPSMTFQKHGAWNPPGNTSIPDMQAFSVSGQVEPTNKVANLNQVPGSVFAEVHAIRIMRQKITLGTASRPLMSAVDDSYGIERFWKISFTFDGVSYERTLNLGKTYGEVRVVPAPPAVPVSKLTAQGPGPYGVGFQITVDLQTWYEVPRLLLDIPNPYPSTYPMLAEEFEVWFPRSKALPGLLPANLPGRFYRISVDQL